MLSCSLPQILTLPSEYRSKNRDSSDQTHHYLDVTSGYWSYCCLSIISNQSAHSPLTSDINKAFLCYQAIEQV